MYAISISDLSHQSMGIGASVLVAPVTGDIVDVEHGAVDGQAVTLKCDDDRAEAIIEVLRTYKMPTLRAYKQGPKGGWVAYK